MKKIPNQHQRLVQDKQDDIFRNMSADRKIQIGSLLWKMAKSIVGDKINYAKSGSPESTRTDRKNSKRS